MNAARADGGWRRVAGLGPRSSVEDLWERRVDQNKRMQLNPGRHVWLLSLLAERPTL